MWLRGSGRAWVEGESWDKERTYGTRGVQRYVGCVCDKGREDVGGRGWRWMSFRLGEGYKLAEG